jgi:hypothetical protein
MNMNSEKYSMSAFHIYAILATFLVTTATAFAGDLTSSDTQDSKQIRDQVVPFAQVCTSNGCKVVYQGEFKTCALPSSLGNGSNCPPIEASCTCTMPDGRLIIGKVY